MTRDTRVTRLLSRVTRMHKDDTDLALAHVDCLRKQGDIALVINLINQSMSIQRVIMATSVSVNNCV